MTWNLWWRFGPWRERQPAIRAELARAEPDVVLLQEVWSDDDADQAEQLASALGFSMARTTGSDGRRGSKDSGPTSVGALPASSART